MRILYIYVKTSVLKRRVEVLMWEHPHTIYVYPVAWGQNWI